MVVKGAGLIASIVAIIIGFITLTGPPGTVPIALWSWYEVFFIIDGILYLVIGVGMLLAKLPFFYAIVAWAPIETPLITYWQGTGQAEGGLDPTLLATISAVIIGVTLVLVTLSGYYIGKTKGKI